MDGGDPVRTRTGRVSLPSTKYLLLIPTAVRAEAPQMCVPDGNDHFTPSANFPDSLAQILFHIPVNNGNRFHHNSNDGQTAAKTIDWPECEDYT
jgi:hypothetical protein